MTAQWHFPEFRPGRARDPQVEKFFADAADRAAPLVREGIQNSLDAGRPGKPVRVRIALGCWSKSEFRKRWPFFVNGLVPHLSASSRFGDLKTDGDFHYLTFEDFETTGLDGDPAQWKVDSQNKNAFFDFFRAEGVSHKSDDDRGRHGLGKYVFWGASQIRTKFALTLRADGRELLMGTCILRMHEIDGTQFMPDGWFGIPDRKQSDNILPIERDAAINRFKSEFGLARDTETGLSIVVPWLDPDVTLDKLAKAVCEGYFLPLMRGSLVVELIDGNGEETRIDGETLRDVVDGLGSDFASAMSARLDLAEAACSAAKSIPLAMPAGDGAPHWSAECIPQAAVAALRPSLAAGEIVRVLCPTRVKKKGGSTERSSFDLVFRRDPGRADFSLSFIRQGILVSGVKCRKEAGLHGLAIIDDGPLATFLGDAENPAHTDWQSTLAKQYSFNAATIKYVTESFGFILSQIREADDAPDPLATIDLFYDADDRDDAPKVKPKKKAGKKSADDEPPLPPPKPKWYRLDRVEGGFSLRPGPGPKPAACRIEMAYDTARGNPFEKYDPNDFALERRGDLVVESEGMNLHEYARNVIVAELGNEPFELSVTGFDPHRDVVVSVRSLGGTVEDSEGDGEEGDHAKAV